MTSESRTLWVLRHADAETTASGKRDRDRHLTDRGRTQAARVGARLRVALGDAPIDHVLCSPAVRTRETLSGLGVELADEDGTDFAAEVYDAGSEELLELVRNFPHACRHALLVGHAPGTPQLVYDLSGPDSDPAAVAAVDARFGTATLARLAVAGPWHGLSTARLDEVFTG